MRKLAALVALWLALAACGAAKEATPPSRATTAPPSSRRSVSPSTSTPSSESSPSPSPTTTLRLPTGTPTVVTDPAAIARIAAGDEAPLAPPGATVTFTDVRTTPADPFDQITLVWRRGEDPFAPQTGVIVWRRSEGAWRAISAFTDRPASGVLAITMETGDATGDGIDDILTFEQTGGSGSCGTWRVLSPTAAGVQEVYRARACDADVQIARPGLVVREAVFAPDDPHCCPSATRITTLEWDGRSFVETGSELRSTGP